MSNLEGLRLAQLVDALPIGVAILDAAGNIVCANRAAESMTGAEYIAGTNERYPSDRLPIARALRGEPAVADDIEIERRGERIAVEVTATPLFDADKRLTYAVAVTQDITSRRRARKLERANKAKNVFLLNISHELRTPLNHIIGFSEILAERIEDPRSRRLAANAGASGHELLDKINDLLELARSEAEPFVPTPIAFDFDALLDDVASVTNARYTLQRPVGKVTTDRDLVMHILSVIMQRSGEAVVTVTPGEHHVLLSVTDARLAARVRAIQQLYGEESYQEHAHFRQKEIDLRLAVVRTEARLLGGDITAVDDLVEVRIPFHVE